MDAVIIYESLTGTTQRAARLIGDGFYDHRIGSQLFPLATVDPAAVAAADVVIKQRMWNHRLVPNAMEPRGVVAHFEPGKGSMTIWSSTQNPHILKTLIAAMTGLGEDRVRAIAPEVGGGFGAKINIYPEEYVAAVVSKKLGPIPSARPRTSSKVAASSSSSTSRPASRIRSLNRTRCGLV